MKTENITLIVNGFKDSLEPNHRYTSYDYCYNYFKQTDDLTKDMEKSCLVLGFYLASWGMFRGSSFLLQQSVKHFEPTIRYISTLDKSYWDIDVDNYSPENIDRILDVYKNIKFKIIPDKQAHLTLVTKVLLGVFGFIPAFDAYFCNTFREMFKDECGFRAVNEKSLKCIKQFYEDNKSEIDMLSEEAYTLDYSSEKNTNIHYTKSKIIDMYGFNYGIINK